MSPYAVTIPHDMDILFALYALGVWGRYLQHWRYRQEAKFKQIVQLLDVLLPYIDKCRVSAARAVAGTHHVSLMAFVTVLLRWPDREQPMKYVKAFEILGDIPVSSIFRAVPGLPIEAMEHDFFGAPARKAVDELLRSTPPRDADLIYDLTMVEVDKKSWHKAQSRGLF